MIYVLAVLVGYLALCAWLVWGRNGFGFEYNRVIAWLLRNVLRKACITLGSTAYVSNPAYLHPLYSGWGTKLYRHERKHSDRWRDRPFTYAPQYLFDLIIHGYKNHPEEIIAKDAEHEP